MPSICITGSLLHRAASSLLSSMHMQGCHTQLILMPFYLQAGRTGPHSGSDLVAGMAPGAKGWPRGLLVNHASTRAVVPLWLLVEHFKLVMHQPPDTHWWVRRG